MRVLTLSMSTMCNLCPKYGKSAGNKRGALNEVRLYVANFANLGNYEFNTASCGLCLYKRFSVVMFVQTINSTLVNYIKKRSALLSDNGKFGLTLYSFGRILSDVRPLYPPLQACFTVHAAVLSNYQVICNYS